VTCEAAERKSLALLREWLSPAQLSQYEKDKAFETIGSKTGKRYRIRQGHQQNVFELDDKGQPVRGLCFVPLGFLASGDVMLAQKIALETDEEAAMQVALPFSAGMEPGRFARLVATDVRHVWCFQGFTMNCLARVAQLLGLRGPAARVLFLQAARLTHPRPRLAYPPLPQLLRRVRVLRHDRSRRRLAG
jgi:hypothetical protein